MVRVTKTIDRLGEQMRTQEAGYTALQANLNQMLDTLRDGVLLFTADRRAVMVSDAVAYFLTTPWSEGHEEMVGKRLEEIFAPETALGAAVLEAFAEWRAGERAGRDAGGWAAGADFAGPDRRWAGRRREYGDAADAARYGVGGATGAGAGGGAKAGGDWEVDRGCGT